MTKSNTKNRSLFSMFVLFINFFRLYSANIKKQELGFQNILLAEKLSILYLLTILQAI